MSRLETLLKLLLLVGFLVTARGFPGVAWAEPRAEGAIEPVLATETVLSQDVVPAGSDAELAVVVTLHGHWHVNAAKPKDPMLIPTALTLSAPAPVTLGAAAYPEPKLLHFDFSEEPLLVYAERFVVRVPVKAAADAAAGAVEVTGKLRYQACDNERCLAPRDEPIQATVTVAAPGAKSKPLHPEVFGASVTAAPSPPARRSAAPAPAGGFVVRLADYAVACFHQGGWSRVLAFAIIFLVGLGLSCTPCVFPVIPITISFFANQSEKHQGQTFGLAGVYVLGMAAIYSVLGAFAALVGKSFGSALGSPWVLIFEAALMVALALSMFGLWEFGIPSVLATRLAASPSGYAGALFMGGTVGIVAAPCVGPAVVVLLGFVANLQSVPLGIGIFFTFALGLGFPFLFLGGVSGAISRLPRSGMWMIWVKHVFGVLILAMALYFLRPLGTNILPVNGDTLFAVGLPVLALVGGIWLGFIDSAGTTSASPGFRRVRMVTGILLLAVSGAGFLGLRGATPGSRITWLAYDKDAFTRAVGQGKPVLVDFTAEWCIPCKELERYTFADENVAREATRFTAFRADGTVDGNPAIEALKDQYAVRGFPTVVIIDSRGSERGDLRVVGFVKPDDFRRRLETCD